MNKRNLYCKACYCKYDLVFQYWGFATQVKSVKCLYCYYNNIEPFPK